MRTSESLAKLAPALLKAQHSMGNIKALGKNPLFRSSYVPLDDFIHLAREVLNANDISIIQSTFSRDGQVGAKTMLLHSSGEFIESDGATATVELSTNKDGRPTNSYGQAAGSLVTYFRRYDGFAILGIAETDNDAQVVRAEPKPIEYVTGKDLKMLRESMINVSAEEAPFCQFLKVDKLEKLPLDKLPAAHTALSKKAIAMQNAKEDKS
tara:strand:- start:47 stop:676 length:630 start_codon:yes stop_codon:yes gene_type:complete